MQLFARTARPAYVLGQHLTIPETKYTRRVDRRVDQIGHKKSARRSGCNVGHFGSCFVSRARNASSSNSRIVFPRVRRS
jgi:hypothetical protein